MSARCVTLGEAALAMAFVAVVAAGLTHAYDARNAVPSYLGEPAPYPTDGMPLPPATQEALAFKVGAATVTPLASASAGGVKLPVYPRPDAWADENAMDARDVVDYVRRTKLPACRSAYEWDANTAYVNADERPGDLSFTCPGVATYTSELPKPFDGDCQFTSDHRMLWFVHDMPTGIYGSCEIGRDDVTERVVPVEYVVGTR